MLKAIIKTMPLIISLLLILVLSASGADDRQAQEDAYPTLDEWIRVVEGTLPASVIDDDNSDLVAKMLSPVLGTPLSKGFNLRTAIESLFKGQRFKFARGCGERTTEVGEISRGECRVSVGDASGQEAYKELSFSKNMVLGNIRYHNREALKTMTADDLIPVKMSDQGAYDAAVSFLTSLFGLPMEEIVSPPRGALLPVKTVALGLGDEKGTNRSVAVEKIVMFKRALYVGAGDYLDYVPGPGEAFLVVNDQGVQEAVVRQWQEVIPHPDAYPEYAKTRSDLVNEIASDLMEYGNGPVKSMNVNFILSAVQRNDGIGLLLPTVRVSVSAVPDDLVEEEQAKILTSAGFVREYSLVHLVEESSEAANKLQ